MSRPPRASASAFASAFAFAFASAFAFAFASAFAFAFASAFASAGCSRPPPESTPEGAVHLYLDRMEAASSNGAQMREVYNLLGPATRKNLEERATRAGRIQGRRIEPYEMLAQGRFALKFRPKSMTSHAEGDVAIVDVVGYDQNETAQVKAVRENGLYKVELDLPDVAPLPVRRDGGA